MKKFVIIMLIAVVAVTSVFAADFSIGIMQNVVNINILLDTEFDQFGIEGALGTPALWYAIAGIDALTKGSADSGSESESSNSGFAIISGAMANVYYKVYTGERFGFRFGMQVDVLGLFDSESTRIMGSYGPSFGFNFKFSNNTSLNFTTAIPAFFLLYCINKDLAQYGAFYYNNSNVDSFGEALGEVFLAILQVGGTAFNQVARLSFKWEI